MEKFHLPVMTPEKGVTSEKREQIAEGGAENPLNAFLKQRFPLSEEGEGLKQRIEQAIDEGDVSAMKFLRDQAPTVERPKLDLFEDFELHEEELRGLLFEDLDNLQVSKGCRHQCVFCGAEAGRKVSFMPFAAILKVAEFRRPYLEQKLEAWRAWAALIEEKTGVDVMGGSYGFNSDKLNILKEEFKRFPGRELLLRKNRSYEDEDRAPTSWSMDVRSGLNNYLDSDPFDYRDSTFRHEDGAPADYGDVFNSLASEAAPIHITTAGWPIADRVAQRAAEKIVDSCKHRPELLGGMRVSVKKYEVMARRDMEKYLRDMENVMRALMPIDPQFLYYYDEKDPEDLAFIEKVIKPLRSLEERITTSKLRHRSDEGLPFYKNGPIEGDFDLMACMPGIHVWPDGTILRQADQRWIPRKDNPNARSFDVPRGSRPTPTGKKLFVLTEK